jgi:hypothetical protein
VNMHDDMKDEIFKNLKLTPGLSTVLSSPKVHIDPVENFGTFGTTAQEDGLHIKIDTAVWDKLDDKEKMTFLEHEVGHILRGDLSNIKKEIPQLYNIACDFVINYPDYYKVIDKGLEKHHGKPNLCAIPSRYKLPNFLPRDIYYQLLLQNSNVISMGMACDLKDETDGKKSFVDEILLREKFNKNATEAEKKKMGGRDFSLDSAFTQTLPYPEYQNIPSWLPQLMSMLEPDEERFPGRSWRRENHQCNDQYPGSLYTFEDVLYKLVFVIDTSGSMVEEAWKGMAALKAMVKEYNIEGHLIFADDKVVAVHNIEDINPDKPPRVAGGGGTDFADAFKKAKKLGADKIVYFTDGYTNSWGTEFCDTIWVLTENGTTPPFGRTIHAKKE